jgi:outer membrane protein OmpA-like peptidoglycan-associated protein
VATAAVLTACSSLPAQIDSLEQARSSIRTLEQDPLANEAAGVELAEAREAIMAADEAYADKADLAIVEHEAYLAARHADIAAERIAKAHATRTLERSRAERDSILLQARENDAERARREAAGEAARAEALERELAELEARQTERGPVLTLSDVLFDTDEAQLKPGAMSTVDRLAQFMAEHPDRRLLIEGHADARGTEAYNRKLSERRAAAVREALVDDDVASDRIRIAGLGEDYPVASNDTRAGMQANRRVEIVISDSDGQFPAGTIRS